MTKEQFQSIVRDYKNWHAGEKNACARAARSVESMDPILAAKFMAVSVACGDLVEYLKSKTEQ